MTEWTIVIVVITLITLITAIVTPLIKVNTSATKLVCAVESLESKIQEIGIKNSESHDRLWKHNEIQDSILAHHETRIQLIECTDKRKGVD